MRKGVRSLLLRRADGGDCPVPGEHKGGRHLGEVDLTAQSKTASGVGEATCAACYGRSLMVVIHFRRSGSRRQVCSAKEEILRNLRRIFWPT